MQFDTRYLTTSERSDDDAACDLGNPGNAPVGQPDEANISTVGLIYALKYQTFKSSPSAVPIISSFAATKTLAVLGFQRTFPVMDSLGAALSAAALDCRERSDVYIVGPAQALPADVALADNHGRFPRGCRAGYYGQEDLEPYLLCSKITKNK
ncbi:hypothetical protein SCARD494_03233 [Seiridium cardinale]